jgi:hypothetical protein
MMTNHRYLLPATLSLALGGLAGADIGAEFLATRYHLGDARGALIANNTPQGETSGNVDGTGFVLHGGFPLGTLGIVPNAGIQLRGSFCSGDEKHQELSALNALGFVPVDGSGTANGTGGVRTLTFATSVDDLALAAVLTSDCWASGRQSISAEAGVVYRELEQTRKQSGKNAAGASMQSTIGLTDDLLTRSYGVTLGLGYRVALGAGFGAKLGVSLDTLETSQQLESRQIINGVKFSRNDDTSGIDFAYGSRFTVDYRYRAFTAALFAELDSSETATVDHALLDSNVYPAKVGSQRAWQTTYGLGVGAAF